MELLICALISAVLGALPIALGFNAALSLGAVVVLPTLAFFLGEYILPRLIHLSPESYDLNQRISEELSMVYYGEDSLPTDWRIYVADDDAQLITAVGKHTLIVARGCYNMRPEEFHFALQEAVEQRRNQRSIALLLATVGNPIFFLCRLLTKIGHILLTIVFMPITLIAAALFSREGAGFREGWQTGRQVGGVMGTIIGKIHYALAILFIKISNVSLLIYSPVLSKMDAAIDQRLEALNLRRVMERVIGGNQTINYTGSLPRENCIIYRTAPQKRIEQLDNLVPAHLPRQQTHQNAPQQRTQQNEHGQNTRHTVRIDEQTQNRWNRTPELMQNTGSGARRSGHQIRIVSAEQADTALRIPQNNNPANAQGQERRPRHQMRILP